MELTGVVSVLNNSQATNNRVVLSEPSTFRLTTPNGTIYQTDRTLTLYNAMGSNTGDYYCMVSNGNTVQPTDRQNFSIFVQSTWSFSIIVLYVVHTKYDTTRSVNIQPTDRQDFKQFVRGTDSPVAFSLP